MDIFKIAKDAVTHADSRLTPDAWAVMADDFATHIRVAFAVQHVVASMTSVHPDAPASTIQKAVDLIQYHYRAD